MKKYRYNKTFTFNGKRYRVYGDTLEEVYAKKTKRLMELNKEIIVYSDKMLVNEWIPECISTYKYGADTTDMIYRINKYILPLVGHYPLGKVTPLQCQAVINQVGDMSYSQIQKLSQDLKFIFKKAVENGLIPSNPAENIVKPKTVKAKRRSLTESELLHFKAISENSMEYILFELMLYCGCRPGEAVKAIRKDISVVDGERMLHIRGTKTANSDRYVPFPDVLWKKVKKYSPFDLLAPNKANNEHTKSSYVRLSERLKRDMNISMGCKTYRNSLIPPYPLAEDFVPYCFRHTYCTNLAKSGVDIRTAQKLMGHSSISMTADVYTHVDNKDIVKAAEQIRNFSG